MLKSSIRKYDTTLVNIRNKTLYTVIKIKRKFGTGLSMEDGDTIEWESLRNAYYFPIWRLDDSLWAAHIFGIYGASESLDTGLLLPLPYQ